MASERRLIRIVTASGAVVVLLHLVFASRRVPAGWGLHALAFFPPWAAVGATALSLILLTPAVSVRAVRAMSRMRAPEWLRNRHLRYGAISLVSVVPFILLRVRIQTLGDGPLWVRELTAPAARLAGEPLTICLVRAIYRLAGGAGDALRAYQVLSWACGAVYVFLALLAGDAIGRDRRERVLTRASLLTPGTMVLFCGYAGHYAPLTIAVLAFLILSLRFLEGSCSVIRPALVWALATALHFSAAALLPSLAFLYFIELRRTPTSVRSAVKVALPLAALAGVLVAVRLSIGLNPLPSGAASHFVPLWLPDPFLRPNALLSPVHLADVANLHLLATPVGLPLILAALFALRDRIPRTPSLLLLGSAVLFYGGLTAVFNPELGAFRDWDLAGPVAVPVVLLGVFVLTRCTEPPTQSRVAWVALVVSAFHLVPWLWVNADGAKSLARFGAVLSDGPRLSAHARGSGYDELRGILERLGRNREALDAGKAALVAHPRHPRYLANVLRLMDQTGSRDELEALLKEVVARDPKFPEARMHLATLYQRSGRFSEGEREYRTALTGDPRNADLHTGLGLLLYSVGRMEEGAAEFRAAVELDGRDPVPHAKLGIYYQEHGQAEKGLAAFRRALALKPNYEEAGVNLGVALYRAGRLDESELELGRVLGADPGSGPAKTALAMVYKDQGRLGEAIRLLSEVLEKAPTNRSALVDLSSLYFLSGDLEGAGRMCERLVAADPHDEGAMLNLCAVYQKMGNREMLKRWERRLEGLRRERGEAMP